MEQLLRQRAESIWTAAIRSVLPDEAVRRALEHFHPQGRVFLVAAGKAAWQMAHAALAVLGRVDGGIVITKYGHVRGPLPGVTCCEAGHPVPDDNSFAATQRALALVSGLRADDTVLFLLSGGGSALFENRCCPLRSCRPSHRRFWPAVRILLRSTRSASGCLPSRAGGSRWPVRPPRCTAWCSATFSATRSI